MLRVILLFSSLFLIFGVQCVAETFSIRKRALVTRPNNPSGFPLKPPIAGVGDGSKREDLYLLDIILVASVDGKFHALNRTSGHTLWSMSASSAFPGSAPPTLRPLVRTNHANTYPNVLDNEDGQEDLYIIEPQSGDIYVMASPTSPLQRLAFSMSQLVDMSPFSFAVEGDGRTFVGSKQTSLFSIELETGKVKDVTAECPWDPFEDLNQDEKGLANIDLDDLEASEPPKPVPTSTLVSIGRTDYHVRIHTTPPDKSSPTPPIQDLFFSSYGPNNRDTTVQAMYRRSADDAYVQSFPNGDIFAFKTADSTDSEFAPINALWGNNLSMPGVTVFDVVRSPTSDQPFVLLQPCPRLEGLANYKDLPNLDSAYVGLVQETQSLFAMSPRVFPLVAFGDSNSRPRKPDVDAVTERRKLRELCRNGAGDRRCLIGVRPLEESRQSWSRLLDAAAIPSGPAWPHGEHDDPRQDPITGSGNDDPSDQSVVSRSGKGNASIVLRIPWTSDGRPLSSLLVQSSVDGSKGGAATSLLASLLFTCLLGGLWVYRTVKAIRVQVNVEFKKAVTEPTTVIGDPQSKPIPIEIASGESTVVESLLHSTPTLDPEAISAAVSAHILRSTPSPTSTSTSDTYVHIDSDYAKASDKDVVLVAALDELGDGDGDESDQVDVASPRKGAKKNRRRGKKKKATVTIAVPDEFEKEKVDEETELNDHKSLVVGSPKSSLITSPMPMAQSEPTGSSLTVSDNVLGFGSHGTVVFSGSLQGRAVAVKRLLQDFVTLAAREVSILQESDDHPNVIRYYYQESQANFLYIALELCPASLADIIESPDQFVEISAAFDPKRALRQITSGLRHLHSLKLVHRDIKPQNILVSSAKRNGHKDRGHRMLISDFGLCKKLEVDQTSFLPTAHGAMAAGTVGWRAPEILRGEVSLVESTGDDSQSSRGSVGTVSGSSASGKPTRLTKLVDIFALGCLFYYTLTNGAHPFGDRFEREVNILKNVKNLEGLERFGEEGSEAVALIDSMLSSEASNRPDTTSCLIHPFFWDQGQRLNFLQDSSDRFEVMCREPRDTRLVTLETGAIGVVGNDWHARLDKVLIDNLGKYRKYDGKSVQDLMRALRNKKHHYQDLPDNVKRHLGPMPEGFLSYFTRRFPRLFLHVYTVVATTSLRQESMFRSYFELSQD